MRRRTLEAVDAELENTTLPATVVASLKHARAELNYRLGHMDSARAENDEALDAIDNGDDAYDRQLIRAVHLLAANIAGSLDDGARALRHHLKIVDDSRASGLTHRRAAVIVGTADKALDAGDIRLARQLLDEAKPMIDESVNGSRDRGLFLVIRGRMHFDERRLEPARPDLERGIAILAAADQQQDYSVLAAAYIHLAQVVGAAGELDRAVDHAQRAIDYDTVAFGPDHPEVKKDILIRNQIMQIRKMMCPPGPRRRGP